MRLNLLLVHPTKRYAAAMAQHHGGSITCDHHFLPSWMAKLESNSTAMGECGSFLRIIRFYDPTV